MLKMAEECCNKNSSGLPMFHLRRVGPPASKPGVADTMDFYKVTYIIGRSQDKVDYLIDSSSYMQSNCISRCHARVVRQAGNQHKVHDDSLNGMFVNNIKIAGSCILREGDRVTFGHIYGQKLPFGSRARQPDSEHQFMFEACQCCEPVSRQTNQNGPSTCATNQNETQSTKQEPNGFKKPVSPAGSSLSARNKHATRVTQSFTQEDVRNLKNVWEAKQCEQASEVDTSSEQKTDSNNDGSSKMDTSEICSTTESNESNVASHLQSTDKDKNDIQDGVTEISPDEEHVEDDSNENKVLDDKPTNDSDIDNQAVCNIDNQAVCNLDNQAVCNIDQPTMCNETVDHTSLKNSNTNSSDKNADEHLPISSDNLAVAGAVKATTGSGDVDSGEHHSVVSGETIEDENEDDKLSVEIDNEAKEAQSGNNVFELEGTVNSILEQIRGMTHEGQNSEADTVELPQCVKDCFKHTKSPTKDACIQTSQTINTEQAPSTSHKSPCKDVEVQTTQLSSMVDRIDSDSEFDNEIQNIDRGVQKTDSGIECNLQKMDDPTCVEQQHLDEERLLTDGNLLKETCTENEDDCHTEIPEQKTTKRDLELPEEEVDCFNNEMAKSDKAAKLPNETEKVRESIVTVNSDSEILTTNAREYDVKKSVELELCEDSEEEHECVVISKTEVAFEIDDDGGSKAEENDSIVLSKSVEDADTDDFNTENGIMLSNSVEYDHEEEAEEKTDIVLSNSVEYDDYEDMDDTAGIVLSNSVEYEDNEDIDDDAGIVLSNSVEYDDADESYDDEQWSDLEENSDDEEEISDEQLMMDNAETSLATTSLATSDKEVHVKENLEMEEVSEEQVMTENAEASLATTSLVTSDKEHIHVKENPEEVSEEQVITENAERSLATTSLVTSDKEVHVKENLEMEEVSEEQVMTENAEASLATTSLVTSDKEHIHVTKNPEEVSEEQRMTENAERSLATTSLATSDKEDIHVKENPEAVSDEQVTTENAETSVATTSLVTSDKEEAYIEENLEVEAVLDEPVITENAEASLATCDKEEIHVDERIEANTESEKECEDGGDTEILTNNDTDFSVEKDHVSAAMPIENIEAGKSRDENIENETEIASEKDLYVEVTDKLNDIEVQNNSYENDTPKMKEIDFEKCESANQNNLVVTQQEQDRTKGDIVTDKTEDLEKVAEVTNTKKSAVQEPVSFEPKERERTISGGRKRHMSSEITEDYGEEGERKRRCSENNDIENEVKANVKKGVKTEQNNARILNIDKLKQGVIKFFKSWSKKSYKIKDRIEPKQSELSVTNESKDQFVYLKDTVGQYRRLSLEGPNENSSTEKAVGGENTVETDEMESRMEQGGVRNKDFAHQVEDAEDLEVLKTTDGIDRENVKATHEQMEHNGKETVVESEIDIPIANTDSTVSEMVLEINGENETVDKTQAQDNILCENLNAEVTTEADIQETASKEAEIEEDSSVDLENAINEEEQIPSGQKVCTTNENTSENLIDGLSTEDELNSSVDVVEASVCYTDNDLENDETPMSYWLNSAFKTPVKGVADQTASPFMSPVIERQGNSQSLDKCTQSPFIAKQDGQGIKISSDVTKDYSVIEVTIKNDDSSSQLSCRFSDDDDDDDDSRFSPNIDFTHLDDEDGIEENMHRDDDVADDDNFVEDSDYNNDDEEDQDNEDEMDKSNDKYTEEKPANKESEIDVYITKEVDGPEVVTISESSDLKIQTKPENNQDLVNVNNDVVELSDDDDDLGAMDLPELDTEDEVLEKEGTKGNHGAGIDFDFSEDESDHCMVEDMGENSDQENGRTDFKRKPGVKRKCNFEDEDDTLDLEMNTHNEVISNSLIGNVDTTCSDNDVISDFDVVTSALVDSFKTPKSVLKQRKLSAPVTPQSPAFSSTQLMESSQIPDLDHLSMSQVSKVTEQLEVKATDRSRSSTSRSKAKDLIEKLRAKKKMKVEKVDADYPSSSPTQGTSQSMEVELYNRTAPSRTSQAQRTLVDVDRHVNSCRRLVQDLKSMFMLERSLHTNPRVQAWRRELEDIEKRLVFPKTVIAVVGDTGAGKSSLMNAILDHRSVLPTSGMRACTAVVVEVVQNTTNNNFEADIEFLQKKEWFDELRILLKDLTGLDGNIKKGQPDPTSDAFVSYCKVRAVYGKIDYFEILSRFTTVTHWLGKVKVIKSTRPADFRRQVEKYIETQDPGAGGQYWPIVKHVRLRMPNCNVCSSGAALVDLPGVRDSNAARDKIAREYLKNCTAVWVVSSIHRAIDDKTAKELLGENFRRQLLMDGQYGSIAFICTKTDVLMPSEIIRSLKLEDKTKEHEDQVSEMELGKSDLDLSITNGNREVRQLMKNIKKLKEEVEELKENLEEIGSLLEPVGDSEQSEEHEALKEYEDEVKDKQAQIEQSEARIQDIHSEKHTATQMILEMEKRLGVHRKVIASICAQARNEYSKSQIRRDFKAGLKEMKRRAGMLNNDDDEEEDLYSDDDDDDDDVGSSADNLQVFCCSSTEYQKMRNLLTDDGPPQVFSTVDETQIPALRNYVHEMTSVRQQQAVERLVQNLGRYVFDLHIYTTEGGTTGSRSGKHTKSAIDTELGKFDNSLEPVMRKLSTDIDGIFDGSIRQKMEEGAMNANSEANNMCAKWGMPYIRDKTQDRRAGGLHFSTYRATTRRNGVFTSPTYGPVDFNEDLAEPMYRCMTIVWDRAFSGMLWKVLDKVKTGILDKLKEFTSGLGEQLERLGIARVRSMRVSHQLHASASHKLTEMVGQLKDIVTTKQRDISRIVTPHVQTSLAHEYAECAAESGGGMFVRMKTYMSQGIDRKRSSMFDDATEKLMHELLDLQNEIEQFVSQVCCTLILDLRTAFEPLWEAPSNSLVLRSAFMKPLARFVETMRQIYAEAGVENTLERAVVPVTSSHHASATHNTSATVTSSSLYPVGDQNVSRNTPPWQTYEETFHKKEETSYGSCEQFGQMGVRVKTEQVSSNCVTETMETVSRVHKIHVKQEKPDQTQEATTQHDTEGLTFGQQTLHDLHCGNLEVSPLEVTVQTTPSYPSVTVHAYPPARNPRATATVTSTLPQNYGATSSHTNVMKSLVSGRQHVIDIPVTVSQIRVHLPPGQKVIWSTAVSSGHNLTQNSTPDLHAASTTTPAGVSGTNPQYAIFTLPNGKQVLTQCQVPNSTTPMHNQNLTNNALTINNKPPSVNVSALVQKFDQSKSNSVTASLQQAIKGKENEAWTTSGTSKVQSSILSFSQPARIPPVSSSTSLGHLANSGSKGQGHLTNSGVKGQGQSVTLGKGKRQSPVTGGKKRGQSLSLSQRNSPSQSTTPTKTVTIKTEPADTGFYGRIKRAKYLGMIDLTEDD